MQARWEAVAQTVIAHAATLGVTLTKNDVERIPAAKIAVLSDVPLEASDSYQRELEQLPQFAAAKERQEVAERLAANDKTELDKMHDMRPSDRMAYYRSLPAIEGDIDEVADLATLSQRPINGRTPTRLVTLTRTKPAPY